MTDGYIITRIQNVPQLCNRCGPAALAAVLNYWGMEATQEDIAADTFHAEIGATHGSDLLLFALDSGLHAYSYRGSFRDLKQKVSAGIPLIVLQMSSHDSPSLHYRVVIGYEERPTAVIVLDPDRTGLCRLPYRAFARLWRPCGRWTMLVVPERRDVFADSLGKRNAMFHFDLATAHLRAGNLRSASREIAYARTIDPLNPAVSHAFGWLRLQFPG